MPVISIIANESVNVNSVINLEVFNNSFRIRKSSNVLVIVSFSSFLLLFIY